MTTSQGIGKPPLAALANEIRGGATSCDIRWIRSLSSAGERVFPYLDDLRNPSLFVAGMGTSRTATIEFMGALDHLEMQKRMTKTVERTP